MNAPDTDVESTDARFAEWMRGNLHIAAEHFGLALTGEPRLGWRLLSISAPVTRGSELLWLRVVTDRGEYASGAWLGL